MWNTCAFVEKMGCSPILALLAVIGASETVQGYSAGSLALDTHSANAISSSSGGGHRRPAGRHLGRAHALGGRPRRLPRSLSRRGRRPRGVRAPGRGSQVSGTLPGPRPS
uniref:Putative secreted protein n=1 Tax=Ixodes ricinus TaxID=34613 RepID=A0A6B0UIY5_IXORI